MVIFQVSDHRFSFSVVVSLLVVVSVVFSESNFQTCNQNVFMFILKTVLWLFLCLGNQASQMYQLRCRIPQTSQPAPEC